MKNNKILEKIEENMRLDDAVVITILHQFHMKNQPDIFMVDIEQEFMEKSTKTSEPINVQRVRHTLQNLQMAGMLEIYHKMYDVEIGKRTLSRGKKAVRILQELNKQEKILQKAYEIVEEAMKPTLYEQETTPIASFFNKKTSNEVDTMEEEKKEEKEEEKKEEKEEKKEETTEEKKEEPEDKEEEKETEEPKEEEETEEEK